MAADARGIFLSYRRENTAGYAGRLYENLVHRFGESQVFIDIDGIDPGVDFPDRIDRALATCAVALVLIGKGWANVRGENGRRRLANQRDFVRMEVERAISSNAVVIPVLVDGASLPASSELPTSLRPLLRRQAISLDNARWAYDVNRLCDTVRNHVAPVGEQEATEASGLTDHRVSFWWRIAVPLGLALTLVAGAAVFVLDRGGDPAHTPIATGSPQALTEVGVPGYRVLFHDDFSDIDSGWAHDAQQESESGHVGYADGGYVFDITRPDHTLWHLVWLDEFENLDDLGDVSVGASVRRFSGEDVTLGVICRAQDHDGDSAFYAMRVKADGSVWIGKREGAAGWKALSKTGMVGALAEEPRVGSAQVARLRFDCTGSDVVNLAAYVNGTRVVTATDASPEDPGATSALRALSTGASGLLFYGGPTGGGTVLYDDYVLRVPE